MKHARTLIVSVVTAFVVGIFGMTGDVAHAAGGNGKAKGAETRFDKDGDGVYDMSERMLRWQERKDAQAARRSK